MTPTGFDFTVTIPGDLRMVEAIRELTAHAAGYAKLSPQAGQALAAHVQRATEQAISAADTTTVPPLEFRFTGDPQALVIMLSCRAIAPIVPGTALPSGNVTIEWSIEGSHHVCRIRQPLPLRPEA